MFYDELPSCGVAVVAFLLIVVLVFTCYYCANKHVAETSDTRTVACYGQLIKTGYIDANGHNIAVLEDETGKQYFECPVHMGVVIVPVGYKMPIVTEKTKK